MNNQQFAVYIMTNPSHTVLYVGVTNNLARRVWEHKSKQNEGFTKKYNVTKLVYYELTDNPESAIAREKQIKKYRREKKDALIDKLNPNWEEIVVS